MKTKTLIKTVSLATLFTGLLAYKVEIQAQTPASPSVYRLYNTHTGEHFYTSSSYEKERLVVAGWSYEGIGWQEPSSITSTPVYRLYNPNAKGGDHYYTKSNYEAQSLVKVGWKWDNNAKPVFYSGGNVNLYVAYNPNAQSGSHNYTTNLFEQNSLLKAGWTYGTVSWQVVGSGISAHEMNLKQIIKGDFSSIQGTWINAEGRKITFNGAKVTGDVNFFGDKGLKEVTLDSNTKSFSGIHSGIVWMESLPLPALSSRAFFFAPKNVSPNNYPDKTDNTRDRILVVSNGGSETFSTDAADKNVFYRLK